MLAGRIYCDAVLQSNKTLQLNKASSHYVSRVLRLKINDTVVAFNGRGGEYHATIKALEKNMLNLWCNSLMILTTSPCYR